MHLMNLAKIYESYKKNQIPQALSWNVLQFCEARITVMSQISTFLMKF